MNTLAHVLSIFSALCSLSLSTAVSGSEVFPPTALVFDPFVVQQEKPASLLSAKAYLQRHASELGIATDLSDISLVRERKSLLGVHYYFKQTLNKIDIYRGEIIVSIATKDGRIYRVFSHRKGYIYPESEHATTPRLSREQAIARAWEDLRVQGDLLSLPHTALMYYPRTPGEPLRMVYRIAIAVTKPFGYWHFLVDAHDATLIERRRGELSIKPISVRAEENSSLRSSVDYHASLGRFATRSLTQLLEHEKEQDMFSTTARGSALVFNPDPRTALLNPLLQKDAPAGDFTAAYETQSLLDITLFGGTYYLQGPYVNIADFEPPNTSPSTSTSGQWAFTRGNNGFNDVMTYFHIDRSQRYLQSLGFNGERGVVNFSLPADSDGLGGDDNSHYVPESKRIAFGHGCVPDNEDAEVIVHEYGHAIELDIIPSWEGGDAGALGEGFGDYWAASYRLETTHGADFQPERLFHWDSHSGEHPCWPGRRINAFDARYKEGERYGAHQPMEEGFIAEELWSTPLYQTLLQAMRAGYAKKDIDRVIIEAHFGLGAGLSMRDMALAIVHTARMLYPETEIAEIFSRNFRQHHIIL